MNQILDFGDGGNNDNNGGKNRKVAKSNNVFNENNMNNMNSGNNFNKGAKGPSTVSDKVVKVFAILMVVLAVALIVSGATSMLKNKKDANNANANANNNSQVQAEILAELNEEEGTVKLTINSSVAISKTIYSWDQGHDNVLAGERQTNMEEDIIVPYGEHVLHVQVTDEQNNKTTKDFTFNSATGIDTVKPEITLTVTEEKKLLITSKDDTSIAYVTYTWNEEEPIKMIPEVEGLREYEFEIEIPRGKNTIVVIAVDGSDVANATTTSKVLEGVTKPVINYVLEEPGDKLQIICSHENGIQSIYYTLNGQPYQWQVGEGEEAPKELSFIQQAVEGHNEMTIKVTSVDGTVAEFNPAWDYVASNEMVEQATDRQTSVTNDPDSVEKIDVLKEAIDMAIADVTTSFFAEYASDYVNVDFDGFANAGAIHKALLKQGYHLLNESLAEFKDDDKTNFSNGLLCYASDGRDAIKVRIKKRSNTVLMAEYDDEIELIKIN